MTLTFRRATVYGHGPYAKIKVKRKLVQELECKQTDGQTCVERLRQDKNY